jgi:fatty acid omega-hydroxylase
MSRHNNISALVVAITVLYVIVALNTLVRRLVAPRLVNDPPPYRQNESLRGPQHLIIAFDRIDD